MSLDTTRLGNAAAELMDSLAEAYENDDGAEIGVVAIVVEVNGPGWTGVDYRASDPRCWVQSGLFAAAARAVDASATHRGYDDEESKDG